MVEFKFSCPQCGQHIQCGVSYAGIQINCPVCQQSIVVPQPPTSSTPAFRRSPARPPRSAMRPRILISVLCAAVLAVGIVAIIFFGFGNSTSTVWKDWSALSGDKNQWNFDNGEISGHSTTAESMLVSPGTYGDVTFSATLGTTNREATLAIRMQDDNDGYIIVFAPDGTRILGNRGYIALIKRTAGGDVRLATYNNRKLAALGQTAKFKVVARGPLIEVWVNGVKLLHASDSTYATGSIGIRVYGDPSYPCDATFSKLTFH